MSTLTRDAIAKQLQTILLTEVRPILGEKGSTWSLQESQKLNDSIDGPGLSVFDIIILKDIVVEQLGGIEFEERWEEGGTTFSDVIDDIIQASQAAPATA